MNINKSWAPQTVCIFDSHQTGHCIASGQDNSPVKIQKSKIKKAPDQPLVLPENLISVCVTVYNYGRFLVECLDSIKNQTYQLLDLVVIDDHSEKDDTVSVAREWAAENAARFYRVRVHSHCRNQGPAEARNTAFRLALGEFVFIIDADNTIYPRAIARLHEAAISGSFDATYSQIEKFGDQRAIGEADIWDIEEMRRRNYVDIMALLRRSAWESIDGFSHIEDGWEDYDFWLKFIDAGLQAAYVPEILCRYRVHGQSRTATEAHVAHEELRVVMAFRHSGFDIKPPGNTEIEPPQPTIKPGAAPAAKAGKQTVRAKKPDVEPAGLAERDVIDTAT